LKARQLLKFLKNIKVMLD